MNQLQARRAAAAGTPQARAAITTWLSVVRSYSLCDTLMARRLGELGVKTAEHEVLANLLREDGLTQQDLAARCFNAKSHVSNLAKALEERGWIRREVDPADARARRLHLTPAGEEMALQTAAVQAEVVAGMCDDETAEALLEVRDAMQRVGARLEAMLAAGG